MHFQTILLAILVAGTWLVANGQPFPKMSEMMVEKYQTEVQLTDKNQEGSAFATEYYDNGENMGRLDILLYGNRKSFFYYNSTGDLLEVNTTSCIASPADESIYYYQEIFYGWLNKDPLIIGPSALLWFTQKDGFTPNFVDTQVIRGIKCEHYQLNIKDKKDEIQYDYYIAASDWTTPYQIKEQKLRVPVRIEVNGMSARDTADEQFADTNQMIDFSYFRPSIDENIQLYPDVGLGCYGREPEPDLTMPKVPSVFRFYAEYHDISKDTEPDARVLYAIWFDNNTQLARLDIRSKKQRATTLFDFNNGVLYGIGDGTVCKILPLRNSFFEEDDGHFLGHIKTPQQVLGLTGDFYYMGERYMRGIKCDVYEKAERYGYSPFGDRYYDLLVTTVYFTPEYMEVINEGEDVSRVPVYYQITGYDDYNVSSRIQFSSFGFTDVVGPTIYKNFPIESCFPLTQQRTYFVLISPVDGTEAATVEANSDLFIDSLRSSLMNQLNVSDMRLPMLKADYLTTGIYVTGLMLDRPPVLSQFWLEYDGAIRLPDTVQLREQAKTKEDCATLCVDETSFVCRGFHMCGQTCLLNFDAIDEAKITDDTLHSCQEYLRAEMNSNNRDAYLSVALDKLNDMVSKLEFNIYLPIADDEVLKIDFITLVVSDGPYVRDLSEKSYKMVVEAAELFAATDRSTTLERPDYNTENDCFQACKGESSIACASFSFCPRAENKRCRISSELVVDAESKNLIQENEQCNIYSLLYLEFFDAYPGKVPLISGDKAFEGVTSPEKCAMHCKTFEGFKCRGFEHCKAERTCILHSKHVFDFKKEELGKGGSNCVHYSAKYMADYLDMGRVLIDDEDSSVRKSETIENCARACTEEMPSCMSFVFCAGSQPGDANTCSMTTKTLKSRNVKTKETEGCRMYTKRDGVEVRGKFKLKTETTEEGYSKNGFVSLVIGMLAFGLIVGIAAFVGFSYFKSKRSDDGLSIKFVK